MPLPEARRRLEKGARKELPKGRLFGSLRGRSEVAPGSLRDRSGVAPGSLRGRSGIDPGSLRDRFGGALGALWGRPGDREVGEK